jgi:hypothetical protein
MADEKLTEELARQIMHWKSAPDRFIKSGRTWIPRWRFQPLNNLEDAFQLLEKAASTFKLATAPDGIFTARVRVGDHIGIASGEPKATSITLAIARAIGLDAPDQAVSRFKSKVARRKDGEPKR